MGVATYPIWTECPGCANLVWDAEKAQFIKFENVFPAVKEKWCRLCQVTWIDSGYLPAGQPKN